MRLIFTSKYAFNVQVKKKILDIRKSGQPNRQRLFTQSDRLIQYSPWQAFQLMRLHSFSTFDETVDVVFHLGVNPKHGDHIVRGSAFMPAGLGKQTKVAVLCPPTLQSELKERGADIFINNETIQGLGKGSINFDTIFTTPQLVEKLKPFGKLLGPRGLMPNLKVGTLVPQEELGDAVAKAKFGQVNFRVDPNKNLHAQIGKLSFNDDQLLKNLESLTLAVHKKKPQSAKGKYFVSAFIKTTMGPRWKLNVEEIDPKSIKNIWSLLK